MGTLSVKIKDDLEQALREKAAKKFTAKKGMLTSAVEEALRDWVSKK